jgi:DNA helicase II / ATP-dependent DNA helicase PcrA
MDTSKTTSPTASTKASSYGFFFDRMDYCLSKGKAFTLFNADDASIAGFFEQCAQRGFQPFTVKFSSIESSISSIPAAPQFVTLIQDLSYEECMEKASLIADKLIFPLWFKRIPVCCFSLVGRSSYESHQIKGDDLHKNSSAVLGALLAEQAFTLLERSNYQFSSPEFLHLAAHKTIFTPIEEQLLVALEGHKLSYQPQVRLGRYTVDFLVNAPNSAENSRVIVECDGRAFHSAARDSERDKVLSLEGYPICRFSGSDIYGDVEKCIETIQQTLNYRSFPSYALDNDLDASQQAAVTCADGPTRVLAPAGSGKTKTLVNRILYLLNQGVPAEKILALAFNKKARDEMQERLDRRGVHGLEVRTFHSLGYQIVREELGWKFNLSTYKQTSKALMRSAILQHTELPPSRNKDPLDAFLAGMRKAKMEFPSLATETVEYGDRVYPFEAIFYTFLRNQLNSNFVDFDDMIYLSIRALLESILLRRSYQARFEYVLVDEFQDLNEAQLLLLQILSLPENNIFAVGDDDQMIYGFRGADIKHILQFDTRFPVSSNHVLNTNYRSSKMIVRHAGWLINHNTDRIRKDIVPRENAQAGRFEVSGHASLHEQATYAASWLAGHKKEHNLNWRDYAVLYRNNAYQFAMAIVLDMKNIPHTPLSGQHLFQTSVGLDVYSYLKTMISPQEATASDFERILKRPNKYFTNQFISQARNWDTFTRLPDLSNLRGWEREKCIDFISRMETANRRLGQSAISASECMQILKTEFGLGEFYGDQARKSDDLDQASDEALFDVITALADNFKTPMDYYQYICKSIDDHQSGADDGSESAVVEKGIDESNEVYLSTIHRAKGKEFRNVVYLNLSQADQKPGQAQSVEEERRVAYVGATRPKDDLLITFPNTKACEFLREIALSPRFKAIRSEELKHKHMVSTRQLEKENLVLKRLELRKDSFVTRFRELTKQQPSKGSNWFSSWRWTLQSRRIDKIQGRIEQIDLQIKKQLETTIHRLVNELAEMGEEQNTRTALGMKE